LRSHPYQEDWERDLKPSYLKKNKERYLPSISPAISVNYLQSNNKAHSINENPPSMVSFQKEAVLVAIQHFIKKKSVC
jgi:hypothetical protein